MGAHPVAHAVGYNDLAEISPYSYQYGVADELSGAAFQQTESDDGTGLRDGSYSVNLPDGRIQHVNYHADDANGYVAEVTYDGSARELVSHTVLVGVGGDLAEIVEPDSVGHRVGDGVHDRPCHGHGSSMHHRAGNSH